MFPTLPRLGLAPFALSLFVTVSACDCGGIRLSKTYVPDCTPEVCDGFDNDCNEKVDDGLPDVECGVGECHRAMPSCAHGAEQACVPLDPTPEVCDGLDNDCDGQVDEELPDLTCGTGACATKVTACVNGKRQVCQPLAATEEICDGVDNDCDGLVDDDIPNLVCGVGACLTSAVACTAGALQVCTPPAGTAETCNGLDDDCNGAVDDAIAALTCGVGACARSVEACDGGVPQTCVAGLPSAETCNGLDDDCNGQADDGLGTITCGQGACAKTVAACVGGVTQSCTPGTPSFEVCDSVDNDCDGFVDDGVCRPPIAVCPASVNGSVGAQVSLAAVGFAVDPNTVIASQGWTVTAAPSGSTAQPTPANSSSVNFTPDVGGPYTLTFCATDSQGKKACCTTGVSTAVCSSPPPPPVSTACGTSWDGRPIVQFSAVPAGQVFQLSLQGSTQVLAQANAGENWLRPALRVASGGPIPGTAVSLVVRACSASDLTCCSSGTPLSVNVVEACSTPEAPTSANVVLSEYVVNGEGACSSTACDVCQAGEAVEITNLSNCPVALDGFHFAYRNNSASAASLRWMNFGAVDVIPPRGVYVAIRGRQYAPLCSGSLGPENTGLYGLRVSTLAMQGPNLCSGWFNNTGGNLSEMQVAPGAIPDAGVPSFTPSAAIARIAPYLPTSGSSTACTSYGFDAVDSCGTVVGGTAPTTPLAPNQLGRLWHPCDAVLNPNPACTRN